MKRIVLAACLAGVIAGPGVTQTTAPAPAEPPIPVAEEATPGSSTPGSMAAGGAAALIIVVLGIAALSSLAFMP